MTTQETGTPTTVTECSHGYKKFSKVWWEKNKDNPVDWTAVKEEYVSDEVLQGLWKFNQATERAGATLRYLSQDPS